MKRALIQIALAGMLCAPTASAAPAAAQDPMAAFYGNTATVSVPPYYYARRFIDPDGTWREPRADDSVLKGVWKLENGQVCSWQTEPAVLNARRYCYPAVARKVGEEWITADPDTGNEVITRLEPGRD